MFIVECMKNQAKVRQTEPITSGSRNVYVVQFKLSEEWDPLTATAVFMAGNRIINVLLDDDRECMVPWEVMQYAGEQVMIGVFGTMNGNVVLPTVWASMGNLQQGVTTGVSPSEPTPSVYQQIVGQLNRLKTQIENGIPYAIDGIVDTTIRSVDVFSDLELPRQVILLNSMFEVEDGRTLKFNNGIVHLEYVDYLDTKNNKVYAVRLTDYDGNVYDIVYDNFTPGGPFKTLVQVRNGDIRNDYELARSEGFTGTLAEWLESLKGKDVLCYLDGTITVSDTTNLKTDHNDQQNTSFTRTPVVGDVLMIPVIKSDITYFVIWKVGSVFDEYSRLIPQSVTRVSPIDGKDGREPIYYIGETITIADANDEEMSDQFTTDLTLLNSYFTRTPIDGDVVTIPVKDPYNSCLITYSVKEINEEDSVWEVMNVLDTIGMTGATGPESLWGNFKLDAKPSVGGNLSIPIVNNDFYPHSSETNMLTEITMTNTFNRLPTVGEYFSGVAVSNDPENNPFVCYISGEIVNVQSSPIDPIANVAMSISTVSDMTGGSSFTQTYISEEDTIASLNGSDEEIDSEAVMGVDSLSGIAKVLSGYLKNDSIFEESTKLINSTDWVETTDEETDRGTYKASLEFKNVENTKMIIYVCPSDRSIEDVSKHIVDYECSLGYDSETETESTIITYYATSKPFISILFDVLTIKQKASTDAIYPVVSLGIRPKQFIDMINKVASEVVEPERGGTGQTSLVNSLTALLNSAPSGGNPLNGATDLSSFYLAVLNLNDQASTNNVDISTLLDIFTGRDVPLNTAGTDYTTLRSRAISLHTEMPTTGLVNGAIYGIYS